MRGDFMAKKVKKAANIKTKKSNSAKSKDNKSDSCAKGVCEFCWNLNLSLRGEFKFNPVPLQDKKQN